MRALIISSVLLAVAVIFVFSSSAWLSGFFSSLQPDAYVRTTGGIGL